MPARPALFLMAMAALVAIEPRSSSAASLLGPGGGNCTTANCAAARFRGVIANEGGFAVPFTIQIQGVAGFCLRLQVTEQDTDLEMVVVAPDGTVWRNDNLGTDLRSIVRIPALPKTGFYTVHLARYDGLAVDAAFTLLAGMYPVGNVNCAAGATSPLIDQGSRSSGGGGGGV